MDFFVFEHLDRQRMEYTSFSELEFLEGFEISDLIYEQFSMYFLETSQLDNRTIEPYKTTLKTLLKSAFAKQLFGDNTAAKVLNTTDPMLQKANNLEANLNSN